MSEGREEREREKDAAKLPGSFIAQAKLQTSTHHLPAVYSLTSILSLLKCSSTLLDITHSNFY